MHEELWAGIALKLDHASFHYEKMGESLDPPESNAWNVAAESAGRIIDTGWHRSLYAHLDAFLSATRSVAEIIKCCFGVDPHREMRDWFDNLPADEKERRCEFRRRFQKHYDAFCQLPLGKARHVSEHRTGYPDAMAKVSGMFGVTYIGSPTKPIPISETRKIDDPNLAFLVKPRRIHPTWTDFSIDGQGLFDACAAYLRGAKDLLDASRVIAVQVHGSKRLTPPS